MTDKFIKGMFPAERKIITFTSKPVLTLLVHEMSEDNQTIRRTRNKTNGIILAIEIEYQKHVLWVARALTLQRMSETPDLVNTKPSGTVQFES